MQNSNTNIQYRELKKLRRNSERLQWVQPRQRNMQDSSEEIQRKMEEKIRKKRKTLANHRAWTWKNRACTYAWDNMGRPKIQTKRKLTR